MSRLEELIQQLCPDGVEYVPLSELFFTRNGYTPSKSNPEFWNEGSIPWFRMEDIRENGRILSDSSQHISEKAVKGQVFPENSIIVATSATIGEHALVTVPSLANQRFTYLVLKEQYQDLFDIKFLFYYCFKLDEYCKANLNQGNFASVDMKKFAKFEFPLVPLPVQQEIVRILDTFTELTAELNEKLTAELAARKKQYEYYRDELLHKSSFRDVRVCKLGEVANIHTGSKPAEILEDYSEFEYINAGTSNSGYVKTPNSPGDTVTTPSRGQGGIGFVGYQSRPFHLGPLCYSIRSNDENIVTNKFIYYWLSSHAGDILAFKKEGGTPALNRGDLMGLRLCVPHISVQHRIVSILDRFDALCNDLTSGLPAEMEARRKQYEYYRDKLLSFKVKG